MQFFMKALAATWSAVIVVACGGGGSDNDSGISTSFDGVLTLDMGDAPVDGVREVNLTVSAIELGGKDGSTSDEAVDTIEIDPPRQFNLLDYQDGSFYKLLDSEDVTSGNYSWIRLKLAEQPEIVENDFSHHDLTIPSGFQTGIKLHSESETLVINGSEDHHYAIDLDLHRSLKLTGSGTYMLKPSYRLIDLGAAELFTASGHINASRPGDCQGALYVYKGDVIPDDIENLDSGTPSGADAVEPFIVKTIGAFETTFSVENLTEGEYTFAFTCDVNADDPDEDNDDDVQFPAVLTTTITSDVSDLLVE